MKRIALALHNGLMAASVAHALQQSGNFTISVLPYSMDIVKDCIRNATDVLLLETAYGKGVTLEDCLAEACRLRTLRPECRVVLLCDENSVPEIAWQVAQAKKDRRIDDFVYSSVSESYLLALLSAI